MNKQDYKEACVYVEEYRKWQQDNPLADHNDFEDMIHERDGENISVYECMRIIGEE